MMHLIKKKDYKEMIPAMKMKQQFLGTLGNVCHVLQGRALYARL